ncbi:energy transducer TonB [Hymenobacter sp. BT770]|uniref:energy transducer TonB n=1 Tax=Hymenobacter sp. BT770 TaxID=2886942 RepID=UPI001D10AE05|nr:energy transducer TonB [Hymenobacter sp. BT770]MCC3151682.1 energy transducer TonB [Hymenobacter sp. BT770]MDO3413740.1 energy transducer TonB [Hymenobacter sp. BT770]
MLQSLRFHAFLAFIALSGVVAKGQTLAQVSSKVATPAAAPAATPGTLAVPMTAMQPAVYPDSVYINPEVRPQFVGGDKAFTAYLTKSIRYPAQAIQRHISGKVYVNFVLNAEGKVQDAHVVRGPGNGLNDEALRLVWLMPAWEPGRVNGQPVRVACTVPISFNTER